MTGIKSLFIRSAFLFSLLTHQQAGAFVAPEGCFGPEAKIMISSFQFTPKSYLGVQDLEDVVRWMEKEYFRTIDISINYDALGFNARAFIESNGNRKVVLNLGLILHPKITKDVIALIGCHEIGHHMGGQPQHSKYPVSVEGQADFFAPQACFHRWLYARILTSYTIRPEVVQFCRMTGLMPKFRLEQCGRALEASVRLSEIFADKRKLNPLPDLNMVDPSLVDSTLDRHGSPQCRLDTFKAGFLSFSIKERQRPGCWYNQSTANAGTIPVPPL